MQFYVDWVSTNPLISAMIQFAILGTLGEVVSYCIREKKIGLPYSAVQTLGKVIAWAVLGAFIKYGFVGIKGFTHALVEHNLLPAFCGYGIGWAFSVAVMLNVFFGPQMMYFHRIEDNIVLRHKGFAGIERALKTLIWFWIPAQTVTFSLPTEFQIGLAAVWSFVLGLILGLTKK